MAKFTEFKSQTLDSFLECTQKGMNVICFGVGARARSALRLCQENNCKIAYFIDNDPVKWGGDYFGYIIKSPREISQETEGFVILITSQYPISKKEQLDGIGKFNIYATCFFFEYSGYSNSYISLK